MSMPQAALSSHFTIEELARGIFAAIVPREGLAIANADEMPTWNPGDEFEAARLKALEAASD